MKKVLLFTTLFLAAFVFIGCTESTTTATTSVQTTSQTTSQPTTVTTAVATTDNDPVLSGVDDITIMKNSTFIPLAGVTATDVEDGDLTDAIQYTGNVNPMAVGEYTATYTVVDSDGNVTVANRTVTVEFTDTQAPLIAGAGNSTIYVGEDFDPLNGVSANDTVDGTVAVTYTGTVDVWTVGDNQLEYSASDNSSNEATASRTVTVSYGDFEFGTGTDYVMGDLTVADGVYSTPAFSGGTINSTIAAFTYVKVMVDVTATAGTINLDLNTLDGSMASFDVTGSADSFEVIYVIDAALTDVTFDLDSNGTTISALDISVIFAEVRDMIVPVLNVPTPEVAIKVDSTQAELDAILDLKVTAVDNIDGNITNDIALDLGLLDLAVVGEYDVIYSVSDAEGNESTFTRKVIVGNAVNSGVMSDPTFQNNGDGLWYTKNSPAAEVSFDASEETMEVLINDLGWGPSFSGAYFKADSNGFEVDQWYVLTFTAKSSVVRQMGFRMGLITDQANGWVDDFNGVSDMLLDLTTEYTTFNYYFKLDSTASSNGTELFIIELNLGAINYSSIGKDGTTTFKDAMISKVVTSYEAPTFEGNVGADLPTTFVVGDTANDWSLYVTGLDMSGTALTATIDSSAVDMNTAGTYDILYSVTDTHDLSASYTLTITVLTVESADTDGPVVAVIDGIPTAVDQFTVLPVYLNQVVTATDAVDGEIAVLPAMVDDGGLNLNVAGIYTLTYTVYDLSGNITVFTVDVTVNDKEAPLVSVNDVDAGFGDAFDATTNLSVSDNVDGVIDASTVVITGLDAFVSEGLIMAIGSFDVTYTVSDAAGNEATKTITVNVSDIEWNEGSRAALGTPDEITHSTVGYNATEEAILITAIETEVASYDHAKWQYIIADTELEAGRTYKYEINVKADVATELHFRIGSTLLVEPWIDNFTGGLKTIAISTEYVTYQVVFTVDKDMINGSAKFEFSYGYLSTDATNTIYVKSFDLVQEKLPEYVDIADMYSPGEYTGSTYNYDLQEGALVINDIVAATGPYDYGRLVYYVDEAMLTSGQTYRIQFSAKSDVATEIRLRIGSTLAADPWIDNFDGGLKTVNVGTEYTTFELVFTVDKTMPYGTAKFQFMYGFLTTDAGNSISIKDFMLQELGPVYVNVEDMYTPNQVAKSTAVYDAVNDVFNITDIELIDGYNVGRLTYHVDQANLVNGETYRIVFTAKSAVATEISLRIGSALAADPWIDNFDGGVKTVYVGTEYTTYELVFTVDQAMPYGYAKFEFTYGLLSTDAGNSIVLKDFYLQKEGVPYSTNTVIVDDFSYDNEAAFGAEWQEGTNWAYVAADMSDKLDLDANVNAMILTLPDGAEGWAIARAYNTLASFGATDSDTYLAFYVTNNTNTTTASVWLYWDGSQNAYSMTLPAIGESGWAFVNVAESGHEVSEIIDFGIAFDDQAWSIYTGSLTVYQIALLSNPLDLLTMDQDVVIFNTFESYTDDADFQAISNDNIEGSRISSGAFVKTNSVLVVDGDNNYIMQNTAYGTNGLKIRITKASIPSQVEYIAIWVQATDTAFMNSFQSFIYSATGYADISGSVVGDFDQLINGTYVYIPVSALQDDTLIVSLVVNCSAGVTGQLMFDNILLSKGFIAEDVVVFNTFETYTDDADFQAISDDNIEGTRVGAGAFVKTNSVLVVDGDNNYIMQNTAYGTNGIKIRITKADIPSHIEYIAFWIQATDVEFMNSFQSFIYTAVGGYASISDSVVGDFSQLINGTYVYIPVSALQDDTVIVSLVVNCSTGVTGQLMFDNISLVKEMFPIVVPVNEAPVVTVSDANLAILSGMTLEAGDSIEALVPTLLGMIDITDAEDGTITALDTMITLNGLDLANPVMGTYTLSIVASDSEGLNSVAYDLVLSIVTVIEDFEGFVDDAALKADWTMLNAFRTAGGGWSLSSGALFVGEANSELQIAIGAGTNGVKLNVTKAELEALGAEYVGIYVQTSSALVGTPGFQAFYYNASYGVTATYGQISFTVDGTYVYIKVSDLPTDMVALSILINVSGDNSGTLTLDNVVIK